ncbi:hypothetical protein [uncultured Adlercreutzia sp.]|uniref:hypothetical protein n=1 Tax=uncultured Adlercreutzia sp. TaxID=875803 RepID=UPI0025D86268|nr:hypothetical protein [uncultured Adlercreutzia sp.]
MELILDLMQMLTAVLTLASALVKLRSQSTGRESTLSDKEGSDAATSEPQAKNGSAR